MKTKTIARPCDPAELRRGDVVRFGTSKAEFVFEWYQESKPGRIYLICHGPLGSPLAKGGQSFYVGKPATRLDPITGKRVKLKPVAVRRVETRKGTDR